MNPNDTLHAPAPGALRLGEAQIGNASVTIVQQLTTGSRATRSAPIEAWLIAEDTSETYGDLVAAFSESGLWPVRDLDEAYLGASDVALREYSDRAPAETIRHAFGLDRRESWEIQEEDFCFDCGPVHDTSGELAIEAEATDAAVLARALDDPGRSFRRDGDIYWRGSSHAPIVLVAVQRPSDFPVVAKWSGPANWPRETAELQIILRSWEERFGAYPYSAGISTMELVVARPPGTIEQARMLARELLHFCPYDTQFHGFRGIESYARSLIGAHWWNFWWD